MTVLVAAAVVTLAPSLAGPAGADEVRDDQWHLGHLDIQRAHEISQGEGITVAVIDSGVDGDHPDLASNVLPGIDAWAATHGEDPGDGWDDTDGHGTGMAGLIAAHGHGPGNAGGALGIAPQAEIIPITISPAEVDPTALDQTYSESYHLAIEEAMNRGADIISISQRGPQLEHIQPALDAGIIVVVGVGNQPDDHFVNAPPGSVAVGAVRPDGTIADVSVRGQLAPPPLDDLGAGGGAQFGFVWLTAPGEDVVTTSLDGGYRIGTGSSPSTAIVSGAAALVWSRHPDLTGDQVVRHLLENVADKGAAGPDTEYGYGDLDIVRALETEPTPPETTPTTESHISMLPPVPQEQAAADDSGGDADANAGQLGVVVAVGGALVAAGSSLGALVNRRRQRSADLHPPPRAPRSTKVLTVVAAVALLVAVGGGIYATTQGDDDSDGTARAGSDGSDGSTGTTELDRSALPVGGPPTEPPTGVAELDEMARGCFDGAMADCDDLEPAASEAISPEHPTAIDYVTYGQSCGGRVPGELGLCVRRLADS